MKNPFYPDLPSIFAPSPHEESIAYGPRRADVRVPVGVFQQTLRSTALIACPGGYHGDPTHECRCTGGAIQRYMGKISGPLLDRIDLHIEVPTVAYQDLGGKETGATSAEMRERVLAARAIQTARGFFNACMAPGKLRETCPLDAAAERTLEMAVKRLALSARPHFESLP